MLYGISLLAQAARHMQMQLWKPFLLKSAEWHDTFDMIISTPQERERNSDSSEQRFPEADKHSSPVLIQAFMAQGSMNV